MESESSDASDGKPSNFPRQRLHVDSSGNSDGDAKSGNSGESARADAGVPHSTKHWTERTLDLAKIRVVKQKLYEPVELLKDWIPYVLAEKRMDYTTVKERSNNIKTHFMFYNPLRFLDFESINDISVEYNSYLDIADIGCASWKYKPKMPKLPGEEHWNHMFGSYADQFAHRLKYMITSNNSGINVIDSMYMELFQSFIGMFGLESCMAVPKEKQVIFGNKEVTSKPDMLLVDFKLRQDIKDAFIMKILLLVQVQRNSEAEDNSPPEVRQRSNEDIPANLPEQLNICEDFSVGRKLIGQHGGDLLLNCRCSSNENGIMGIILQKTNVTFTCLKCSEEQFDAIKSGDFPEGLFDNRPSMLFSRKYNFLKADDREHLIEPFIFLSLLQSIK